MRRALSLRCCVLIGALVAGQAQASAQSAPGAQLPPGANLPVAELRFGLTEFRFGESRMSSASGSVGLAAAAPALQVKEERGGLRFTLAADVLFDFDKSNLRPEADPVLRQLTAEVRTRLPAARYQVEGHTDGKGTDSYNNALSLRRADSVRAWLSRNASVAGPAVTTAGFGKSRPVAPNANRDGSDNPEGRQKNRRVEILVLPAR